MSVTAEERLRRQNHEAAERRDRETAELVSKVARYENAYRRAKELVRGSPVDWTDDPGAQEADGWWTYTSQQNRDILMAAILDADAEGLRGRLIDILRQHEQGERLGYISALALDDIRDALAAAPKAKP